VRGHADPHQPRLSQPHKPTRHHPTHTRVRRACCALPGDASSVAICTHPLAGCYIAAGSPKRPSAHREAPFRQRPPPTQHHVELAIPWRFDGWRQCAARTASLTSTDGSARTRHSTFDARGCTQPGAPGEQASEGDTGDLGFERGHRTLRIVGNGHKPTVIPLVPRTQHVIPIHARPARRLRRRVRRRGMSLDRRRPTIRRAGTSSGFRARSNALHPPS
jgi:hypothetical protein